MNLKYPLFGALATLLAVLLSAGLSWLAHNSMITERSGRPAVWRFAPLAEGTRFEMAPYHLYPASPSTPSKDRVSHSLSAEDIARARERVLEERRKP